MFFSNDDRVLFRLEDMRPRENESYDDNSLRDEDVVEPNFNNDDHDDDNVDDDEYDHDNEEPENVNKRNQENNNNINHNQPLFDGAPLTVGDSMLVILSLLLRHNLTMACIEDIIKAIELHCIPQGLKKIAYINLKNISN